MVFVPGTAPGDVVKVRITERKPRFLTAELVEILEPGPSRRRSPCAVADRCGGCSWQHVEYAEQLRQKEKILKDSLRKIEKQRPFEWRPFIPAPDEFHYRNRIQLQVRAGKFGFFSKGTRDLVEINRCWIADEKINYRLNGLSPADLTSDKLEVAVNKLGGVVLMPDRRDPEEALFSQVNSAQNANLIQAMLTAVIADPAWLMDLYCGSGNLTVPLAHRFPGRPLHAVDLSKASIDRAPTVEHVTFSAGDVAKVLAETKVRQGTGLIVLDPPRAGCDTNVIGEILRHSALQIIYVSCNPSTFARDAERLVAGGRYKVQSVQGLDMFPQTEHVELIASLCTV